jgi:hypothetical protein
LVFLTQGEEVLTVEIPGLDELQGLPPEIQIIGIWGILALLVIRVVVADVLPWAKRKKNGEPEPPRTCPLADNVETVENMAQEVRDLHESHLGERARDEDGNFKWWNKPSTTAAILQTRDLLRDIKRLLEDNLKAINRRLP